jgi:hypothetical protein
MYLFQQLKLCTDLKKIFCCLSWERLATTLYRGRLTNWQIFKGKVSLKAAASSYHSASDKFSYFWPECEAGRMKKILNHNWSLLCRAYGEGSLICHGLIGLYIPSVVVVSHTSGGRKYLWWRQCGPVMSSWSNGLLAGLLKWRQNGPEVS